MIYPIITMTQLKLWIKETTTTDFLTLMQQIVTDIAESIMQQYGVVRSITEYHDGKGHNNLLTEKYPIYSIASINDDVNHDWDSSTLIADTNYIFDKKIGEINLINDYRIFSNGNKNVKIIYRAGFSGYKVIEDINDTIDFDEGSSLVATIDAGEYDAEDLATAIATALNNAGANTYTCEYNHNTQKFTISSDDAIDWLFSSGSNVSKSIAPLINVSIADVTGNTTVTSGEVTGIPNDIVLACQQIVLLLYHQSKQGLTLQMIKSKQMSEQDGSGTIEYYGNQLPGISMQILKSKRRIGF